MNTGVFFVFLALSGVLVANVTADVSLIDTMFFRYYNRANNLNIDIKLENVHDIVPLLNKSETTVIYIHGYLENVEMPTVKILTEVLLKSTSVNVLSLDYRQMALIYPVSVEYVPQIGAAVAAAINDMVEVGLDGAAIHLIGFSLGAQICGHTGRNTAQKVNRITGIDPAGPLIFTDYLTIGDALFVCIIHTDMAGYGIERISGNVDFMPNFGHRMQPGCTEEILQTFIPPDICSHLRVWAFFVESIANPNAFLSVKCNTDSDFKNRTCDTSSIIPMGYGTPNNASGVYYCQTNSDSPYNLGMSGTVYKNRI